MCKHTIYRGTGRKIALRLPRGLPAPQYRHYSPFVWRSACSSFARRWTPVPAIFSSPTAPVWSSREQTSESPRDACPDSQTWTARARTESPRVNPRSRWSLWHWLWRERFGLPGAPCWICGSTHRRTKPTILSSTWCCSRIDSWKCWRSQKTPSRPFHQCR